jgi:transposase
MRYELTDYEWAAIKPMLPRQPLAALAERLRARTDVLEFSISPTGD